MLIYFSNQGFHNLCAENHAMHDPLLTPFGEEQCTTLRESFPYHHKISLLISSPLRRTIYTTLLSFGPALSNGHCTPNVLALPEIQETSDFPCDTGSDVDKLREEMTASHLPVDLTLVKPGWNVKTLDNKWAPGSEALTKRAREARVFIREKIIELQKEGEVDPEIIVVTHGGLLHYFTEDWEDSGAYNGESLVPITSVGPLHFSFRYLISTHLCGIAAYMTDRINEMRWDIPGTGWRNTEYRSFNFADLDHTRPSSSTSCTSSSSSNSSSNPANATQPPHHLNDYENATLRETAESRSRRGKAEPQHPRHKQTELFQAAMQGWEDQGLQNPDKVGLENGKVVDDDDDDDDDGQEGLVRVLTKDSENADSKGGEAPATDRRGEDVVVDAVAKRERARGKSVSVAA
jgi:broad specificity phosphatase PhoE